MRKLIHIPLEYSEVLEALKKALQQNFIDNLRNRHQNVQLDSCLRGYVGEIAFKKYMLTQEVRFQASNTKDVRSGMDVDFSLKTKHNTLQIELKTSLIPDVDETIERFVENRDLKLIQRGTTTINQLKGDIHAQIVFKQMRLRKDDWLQRQSINLEESPEKLYEKLAAFRYESDVFFVGWIDKQSLIEQIKVKPKHMKQWKYGKRKFWCCNLATETKEADQLAAYLKNLL